MDCQRGQQIILIFVHIRAFKIQTAPVFILPHPGPGHCQNNTLAVLLELKS
jgi:hypothetical protein